MCQLTDNNYFIVPTNLWRRRRQGRSCGPCSLYPDPAASGWPAATGKNSIRPASFWPSCWRRWTPGGRLEGTVTDADTPETADEPAAFPTPAIPGLGSAGYQHFAWPHTAKEDPLFNVDFFICTF